VSEVVPVGWAVALRAGERKGSEACADQGDQTSARDIERQCTSTGELTGWPSAPWSGSASCRLAREARQDWRPGNQFVSPCSARQTKRPWKQTYIETYTGSTVLQTVLARRASRIRTSTSGVRRACEEGREIGSERCQSGKTGCARRAGEKRLARLQASKEGSCHGWQACWLAESWTGWVGEC
jgi:hypothetical protein